MELKIQNITQRYRDKTAVDDVSITLWPYPEKAFAEVNPKVKGYLTIEMAIMGQMTEDVRLATRYTKPVYSHLTAIRIPVATEVVENAKKILDGKVKEEVSL